MFSSMTARLCKLTRAPGYSLVDIDENTAQWLVGGVATGLAVVAEALGYTVTRLRVAMYCRLVDRYRKVYELMAKHKVIFVSTPQYI